MKFSIDGRIRATVSARLTDAMLLPPLKPVALKDASIDVIRRFDPAAALHRDDTDPVIH
jgi:hypothetical protein